MLRKSLNLHGSYKVCRNLDLRDSYNQLKLGAPYSNYTERGLIYIARGTPNISDPNAYLKYYRVDKSYDYAKPKYKPCIKFKAYRMDESY